MIINGNFIKSAAARMGIDINRLSPTTNSALQIATIVRDEGVDLVFDVGGNRGQYAMGLRQYGYAGRIVSFEPLEEAHAILTKVAGRDANWHVHDRCAIGASEAMVEINVSQNLSSSSLLEIDESLFGSVPNLNVTRVEKVELRTLNRETLSYLSSSTKPFLKIDTQGYELEVLLGATEVLDRISGVQLELSLVEIYKGQPLWLEMIDWLSQRGFDLWAFEEAFVDPRNSRTLQIDGLFMRRDMSRA